MKTVFFKNVHFSFWMLLAILLGDSLCLSVWVLTSFMQDLLIFTIGYTFILLLLIVLALLQKVKIGEEEIVIFRKNRIYKRIDYNQIAKIEVRRTTYLAVLDQDGCVMCFLERRKKIKKCLEMHNINIS